MEIGYDAFKLCTGLTSFIILAHGIRIVDLI